MPGPRPIIFKINGCKCVASHLAKTFFRQNRAKKAGSIPRTKHIIVPAACQVILFIPLNLYYFLNSLRFFCPLWLRERAQMVTDPHDDRLLKIAELFAKEVDAAHILYVWGHPDPHADMVFVV